MKIEGYICHFGVANLNGEIVTADSFKRCLKDYAEKGLQPGLNYNHESGNIVGKIIKLTVLDDGIYMEAELNEDIKVVQDFILPLVKDNTLKCFSTEGYVSIDKIEKYSDGTYLAKEFYLTAVAIVPVPADMDSQFSHNNLYHRIIVDTKKADNNPRIRLSVVL